MSFDPHALEAELRTYPAGPLAARLPPSFVLPRYDGRSLVNLPSTIGHLLGQSEGWVAPPLERALWEGLAEGVERVVLLLVDGVGWRRLWQPSARAEDDLPRWLDRWGATCVPLTSVAPSTTSVATSTLWGNGAAPAEHGLLGFSALLEEMGSVCNLLFWHTISPVEGEPGSLPVQPETFLPTPSIAQVLARAGLVTFALKPQDIVGSPLSRVQGRGARSEGYSSLDGLWAGIQRWLLECHRGYAYAYFPDFDTLSHLQGPDTPLWDALWEGFHASLDRFLATLPTAARRGTLLLITADHGHIHTPSAQRHLLQDHPDLQRLLRFLPGGEPRHLYLYAAAGQRDAVRDYCLAHLADDFHLLDAGEALRGGLYGNPVRLHPDAVRRLGDWVLLAKGGASGWHPAREQYMLGMHGALEPEEMLVPFFALRLDG